jgi:hypothetical protein
VESRWYYYKNRYYSAVQGRFVGRDPIAYKRARSLYHYARHSPTTSTDPSGLYDIEVAGEVYTGLGGGGGVTMSVTKEDCCKNGKAIKNGKFIVEGNAYATIGIGLGFKGSIMGVGVNLTLKGVRAKPLNVTISAESDCGTSLSGEMCWKESKSVDLGVSGAVSPNIGVAAVTISGKGGLHGSASLKTCIDPATLKGYSELRFTGTSGAQGQVGISTGPVSTNWSTSPWQTGWEDVVVWSTDF